MKGETVGAQVGTVYVEPLKKTGLFADVKIYDTIPDLMRDVNTGRLKAAFGDYPILAYNVQQGNFPDLRLVKSYKSTILGSIGIGMRKDNPELLNKINYRASGATSGEKIVSDDDAMTISNCVAMDL